MDSLRDNSGGQTMFAQAHEGPFHMDKYQMKSFLNSLTAAYKIKEDSDTPPH